MLVTSRRKRLIMLMFRGDLSLPLGSTKEIKLLAMLSLLESPLGARVSLGAGRDARH
jgi:hypothetical protein